jgi:4-aminobutyrate aminotransferase
MIEQLTQRRIDAVARGLTIMSDIYVSHAKNAEVWSVDGRHFIDFATGTSTMNVGHSHPKVVSALHNQIDKFTHSFFQQLPYESYITLAERLNKIVPGDFSKKTVLFTDGAGAVENAIKIAKVYTNRSGVISFNGAFHGRTLFTSTLAGKVAPYKSGLGTPAPETYQVPFPSLIDGVTLADTSLAFKQLFKHVVDPARIAAIIVEPVQGEGGFRPATKELMQLIRSICDEHGIVMIADEIQSGYGRTGKMFAMEHFDVSADLTTMSKSIAAGIPMSAVTGKAEIMDSTVSGGLGGTYNGNPLACVAALAVLDIIEEEQLLLRSQILGKQLLDFLHELKNKYSQITDVRGIGSMIAVELLDITTTKAIQSHARQHGLILITAGVNSNVIRFLYPLTITDDVFSKGLKILSDSIEQICNN